jgi:hypothetical protein
MAKALLVTAALLLLTGCTTASNLKATPLKDQSAVQVQSDRKRCDEWSQKTTAVLAGFAACLVASGYETTPEVGSTSQTVRLARTTTAPEPTRVLIDVLDCDSQAQREAERDLGTISRWIRENLVYWRSNMAKRRQVFVECIKPRGYELGTS